MISNLSRRIQKLEHAEITTDEALQWVGARCPAAAAALHKELDRLRGATEMSPVLKAAIERILARGREVQG